MKYKITRKTVSLLITIGLLFFCRGLKMTVFAQERSSMPYQHPIHTNLSQLDSSQMSCCGTTNDTTTNLMEHTIEALIPSSIDFDLSAIYFAVLISVLGYALHRVTTWYGIWIRDRYGSWRSFIVLIKLFQTGILHPKILA